MARVVKGKGGGAVRFNMTPMIDIVFNLIIFFMLISNFSQLEKENVVLPLAERAEAKDVRVYSNVVINIIKPKDPEVKILGNTFEPIVAGPLEAFLVDMVQQKGTNVEKPLNVILRADARVPYEAVAAVMLAAGKAKIEGWWITTEIYEPEKRGG
jgi:biopolymer transport protein ExbD